MDSLCRSCVNVQQVVSGTGSTFLLCRLSLTDKRFPKYPPQPIGKCPGHEVQIDMQPTFDLKLVEGRYAVCRLLPTASVPLWVAGDVVSTTRTPDELSIVCLESCVPSEVQAERGWNVLLIVGPLELSMVGVLASITSTLAEVRVSVFAISTFDTDYLLIQSDDLYTGIEALRAAGHSFSSSHQVE